MPLRPTLREIEQSIAIEKENYRVNLNKPIYIGINILDLSKVL